MTITDYAQPDKTVVLGEVAGALQRGDTARATELARTALDRGVEHPLFLNLRAFWHESAGREPEAHIDLLRARTLAPDDAPILNALGLSYGRNGFPREAVECFDRVIALMPNFGPGYFNKGWTSEQIGELATARECYLRAIALMPKSGGPLAHMASLLTRLGQWTAAKAYAEQALALEPGIPKAELTLAGADQVEGRFDAAEARVRQVAARQDMDPYDRAQALGQLGDILDLKGETAEAFRFYRESNEVTRKMHSGRFANASPTSMHTVLGMLTKVFEKADPAQWSGTDPGSPDPDGPSQHVFLLGFPRSGTTLLEQVLDSHPNAVTSGERDTLIDSITDFMCSTDDVMRLAALRGSGLARQRRRYWEKVRSYGFAVRGRVFVDKQPVNTVNIPLIAKLFPNAKILFAIRDPRDVVLSCFRRRFQINRSNFELLTLDGVARYYDAVMRLAELYRAKLPLDLIDLRHEELVDDFQGQMDKICDFIGLPWDESMKNFAQHAKSRPIATPSASQVARGLNREGMAQWRRYAREMEPILPILRPWVERYGYSPE